MEWRECSMEEAVVALNDRKMVQAFDCCGSWCSLMVKDGVIYWLGHSPNTSYPVIMRVSMHWRVEVKPPEQGCVDLEPYFLAGMCSVPPHDGTGISRHITEVAAHVDWMGWVWDSCDGKEILNVRLEGWQRMDSDGKREICKAVRMRISTR